MDMALAHYQTNRPTWRFDTALLADGIFCERISDAIDYFLLSNKSDLASPSTLWETLKAVIRGEIISYRFSLNKARNSKQKELIDTIRQLDHQYSISPSPTLYKERLSLQTQYNLISTEKTEQHLLRSRGYLYK